MALVSLLVAVVVVVVVAAATVVEVDSYYATPYFVRQRRCH